MSGESVLAAYCAVGNHPDESGFDANDPRHPRWCHPVRPEEGGEPMAAALTDAGVVIPTEDPYAAFSEKHGDGVLIYLKGGFWVPRWPDKNGMYGWGTSPQYAIRSDMGRLTLEQVIERAKERCR